MNAERFGDDHMEDEQADEGGKFGRVSRPVFFLSILHLPSDSFRRPSTTTTDEEQHTDKNAQPGQNGSALGMFNQHAEQAAQRVRHRHLVLLVCFFP